MPDEKSKSVKGECYLCGGKINIGKSSDDSYYVTHTMPACDSFLKLEILEFLAANRKKAGIQIPEDS